MKGDAVNVSLDTNTAEVRFDEDRVSLTTLRGAVRSGSLSAPPTAWQARGCRSGSSSIADLANALGRNNLNVGAEGGSTIDVAGEASLVQGTARRAPLSTVSAPVWRKGSPSLARPPLCALPCGVGR